MRWQANFCTDMLNLAEFKGLVHSEIAALPTVLYFHENQFEYPSQNTAHHDIQFSLTNFSSALAADLVWFNSAFNRDSMFAHLQKLSRKWRNYLPEESISLLQEQCEVFHPGIEAPPILREPKAPAKKLHLIWAARWEHDKGPDQLLQILTELENREVDFQLSVIGQSFQRVPEEFEQIASRFESRIVVWGYQDSRQSYWKALSDADVFLSTARHEFFGLSAVEAIRVGLYPLLPNQLAYPELLSQIDESESKRFLYNGIEQAVELIAASNDNWDGFQKLGLPRMMKERFDSVTQAKRMDAKIASVFAD